MRTDRFVGLVTALVCCLLVSGSVVAQEVVAPLLYADAVGPMLYGDPPPVAGCEQIGDWVDSWTYPSRFRGNAYQMEADGRLLAFGMELGFFTDTTLYWEVMVRDYDTQPATWVRSELVPEAIEVVEEANGRGLYWVEFDPPLLMEAGKEYMLGVSWGSSLVSYGRELQASTEFSHGTILGGLSRSLTSAPPLDEGLPLTPTSGSIWSSQICFAPDPGACCIDGVCHDLLEYDCLVAEGQFSAPMVQCVDDGISCPMPPGACCLPSGCQDRNVYACEEAGGDWLGEGTECGLDPCTPRGACCVDESPQSCLDGQREVEDCLARGGIYRGDNSTCDTLEIPCTAGACCTNEGCDFHDSMQGCIEANGSFAGRGTSCDDNPCVPVGACTVGDTCYDEYTEDECDDLSGSVYRGDWSACDTLFPGPGRGACCHESGCVQNVTASSCLAFNGDFRGVGTECGTLDSFCPGNCCTDFGCEPDIDPSSCTDFGYVFAGYGEDCEDNTVCDEMGADYGAWCMASGECVMAAADIFPASVGQYQGNGTDCGDVSCTMEEARACCTDGVCSNVTPTACGEAGGTVLGEMTCAVGLCGVIGEGACCQGSTCEMRTLSECVAVGGEYRGHDTGCGTMPCASILDADPLDGAIDARRPSDLDGSDPTGWVVIDLLFDVDMGFITEDDFAVTSRPLGVAPGIASVIPLPPNGELVRLILDRPMEPGAWITIRHIHSGSSIVLGYLPGDVNADEIVNGDDVTAMIGALSGMVPPPLYEWQYDVNRSGSLEPGDLVTLINLLNGADGYEPWIGVSLP